MSRKRDTNWSRDEITVLLDSIMEITRLRAVDGKRTNSKEVFEYAAKKMGECGHQSRAEREKCRTKWKKMKEEFTHAKRAREGDPRHKEAPGIQPFYDRMEEFIINGNHDNISPHSTIVRRTSSLSNSSNGSRPPPPPPQLQQQQHQHLAPLSPEKRASARIAATHATITTNGTSPNDNHDTSSTTTTIVTRANTTTGNGYPSSMHTTTSNSSTPPSHLNTRLSSGSNNNNSSNTITATNSSNSSSTSVNAVSATSNNNNSANTNAAATTTNSSTSRKPQERTPLPNNNGELSIYTAYNEYPNSNSASTTGSSHVHLSSNDLVSASPPDHADISYRVSSGYRQITIFGDHDVDIKFRRDRVTINKIEIDYQTTEA